MTKLQFLKTRLAKQIFGLFSLPFFVLAALVLAVGLLTQSQIFVVVLFPPFVGVAIMSGLISAYVELNMIGTRGTPTSPCPTCGQMRYAAPVPNSKRGKQS